jgi:hypothetical protein
VCDSCVDRVLTPHRADTGPQLRVHPRQFSLALDFNITALAGASAAVTVNLDRKGLDGVWYNIYTSGAKNAPSATSASIGPGESTNVELGSIIRVGMFVSNTVSPSAMMSLSVVAKS